MLFQVTENNVKIGTPTLPLKQTYPAGRHLLCMKMIQVRSQTSHGSVPTLTTVSGVTSEHHCYSSKTNQRGGKKK